MFVKRLVYILSLLYFLLRLLKRKALRVGVTYLHIKVNRYLDNDTDFWILIYDF